MGIDYAIDACTAAAGLRAGCKVPDEYCRGCRRVTHTQG